MFSPVEGSDAGFLTIACQNSITVINTQTYQTTGTLPIPTEGSGRGRSPLPLRISADGTLFAIIKTGTARLEDLLKFVILMAPRAGFELTRPFGSNALKDT